MIFFGGGGGALALDDGECGPLLFQKGGIFPTTNKTLKVIYITSYSILHIYQVFMLIEISKIQFIGTCYYQNPKKRLQVGYNCHHVTSHSHELMSLVSINCVNIIECYWSLSHNLRKTMNCLPRVL